MKLTTSLLKDLNPDLLHAILISNVPFNAQSIEYEFLVSVFTFYLISFKLVCCLIFIDNQYTDDKSNPSKVHVFVPANDPAASASGHTMMVKRSSQVMDDVNLETA